MDYACFVSKAKSFVVAPAGYGKTHAIAVCLKYTLGRQLILTHTHAGVAAIKDKIQSLGILNTQYRVETISSFAQKYVNAFYCGTDIPEQEDSRAYHPFIIDKAKNLFKIPAIRYVISCTYDGLFVDEYQDCNIGQHLLIRELASILPTRILGDHLQGIFDFNGDVLVDFARDLNDFEKFPDLPEPWRWKNKNPGIGESFKKIRYLLEQKQNIDLKNHESDITILLVDENDKYKSGSEYNKKIWNLAKEDNVLIIHPDSANLNARKDFTSRFNNSFILVEAIDGKDFYTLSRQFDNVNPSNVYSIIYSLIPSLFNGSSNRDKWFSSNGIRNKRSKDDRMRIMSIGKDIETLKQKISLPIIAKILRKIKELPGIKCYRQELLWDLCNALEYAGHNNTLVYEAMTDIRNRKRRGGRKITGRCIGTTLLTKGLEFDIVAVLDAHNFKCPKNFYVAITRACKRLIIFTNNKLISPYSN